MLKFLGQVLLFSWIIDGIKTLRKNIKSTEEDYNDLSKEVEKFNREIEEGINKLNEEIEETSKDKERLKTAGTCIYVMGRDGYQEYVEKHKTSIAKIIKAHYEKNTLTWENRDLIIQDIVEDMGKVKGAQIPEMKYIDTVLIHFLLYHKRDALSDLVGIDKKKITLEWKE
ncbi:MAG: hypothetical protein ACFN4U_03740 [Candidatus Absconditicoccaceae bacterium]